MKGFVWSCFVFLLLFSCSEKNNNKSSGQEQIQQTDSIAWYDSVYADVRYSVDTFFGEKLKRDEFNGNVLFAQNGYVLLEKSYGCVSPDSGDSLKLNHRFQLASVSKPFTATAILILREQGKLSLDDSVSDFIDSFPYPGITVRMLLCHRGGLGNYNYFTEDFWQDKTKPVCNDSVIAIMKKHKPKCYYKPNEFFDYSNTGYMLLASIVESVSGKTFGSFMQEHVFVPLGMKNSSIYEPCLGVEIPDKLEGYDWKGRKIENSYQNGVVGDKGMYSTVGDLFLFDQAIRNGNILKKEVWEEMFVPHNPEREKEGKDNYGLGWRLKTSFNGYRIVYHTGWWKGFRSYFIRNITLGQTIIITDNIKRNRFLSIEELLDLADGGAFGSAASADSLSIEGGKPK